jgi:hypothetical protein
MEQLFPVKLEMTVTHLQVMAAVIPAQSKQDGTVVDLLAAAKKYVGMEKE